MERRIRGAVGSYVTVYTGGGPDCGAQIPNGTRLGFTLEGKGANAVVSICGGTVDADALIALVDERPHVEAGALLHALGIGRRIDFELFALDATGNTIGMLPMRREMHALSGCPGRRSALSATFDGTSAELRRIDIATLQVLETRVVEWVTGAVPIASTATRLLCLDAEARTAGLLVGPSDPTTSVLALESHGRFVRIGESGWTGATGIDGAVVATRVSELVAIDAHSGATHVVQATNEFVRLVSATTTSSGVLVAGIVGDEHLGPPVEFVHTPLANVSADVPTTLLHVPARCTADAIVPVSEGFTLRCGRPFIISAPTFVGADGLYVGGPRWRASLVDLRMGDGFLRFFDDSSGRVTYTDEEHVRDLPWSEVRIDRVLVLPEGVELRAP